MESPAVVPASYDAPSPGGLDARRWSGEALAAFIAARFAIAPSELHAASRRAAAVALARQVAMYLARVVFGATYSEIGRAFGRDRTTAAHACRAIEERRDDPQFDAMLDQLERACLGFARLGARGEPR